MTSDEDIYADDSFDLPDVPEHPFYQQQAQNPQEAHNGSGEFRGNVREEAEGVADHYNARPDAGVAQRGRSPILHLRSFNNWVKSVLIREFLSAPKLKVLDLACGKGGDLLKWDKASASHVTGVDIAEVSIQHARERFKSMRTCFDAKFIPFDAFHKPWPPGLLPFKRYDAVSCQFAFHYSFASEDSARNAMKNVASVLKSGGYFFGVIPNAHEIRSRLQSPEYSKDGRTIQNQFYKLVMDQPIDTKFPSPFGIRYEFTLVEAVEACPEFIVPFSTLERLADEAGLIFIMEAPLQRFYETYSLMPEYQQLLHRMNIVEDTALALSMDELSIASLYMAFAFRRK